MEKEKLKIAFFWKNYATDKIFTRPPVAAVAPNINSGCNTIPEDKLCSRGWVWIQPQCALPLWVVSSQWASATALPGVETLKSLAHLCLSRSWPTNHHFLINNHNLHLNSLHYRLRGSMGFEKYKKWTKVDTCFSLNNPTKQEI